MQDSARPGVRNLGDYAKSQNAGLAHRRRVPTGVAPLPRGVDGRLSQGTAQVSHRVAVRRDARTAIAGLALGGLVVAATHLGSSMLILLTSVVVLAASVLVPVVGLTSVAFLAPLVRPLVIPAPGFYVAIAGALAFGVILRLPIDRPRLRLPSAEVLLLGLFVLYAMAHVIAGLSVGQARFTGREAESLIARLVESLAVFGVAYVVLRRRSPYPILAAMLAASAVAAVLALSQTLGAEGAFTNLMPSPDPSGRISGVFGNTNYFGAYLASMATLATALAVGNNASRTARVSLLVLVMLLAVTLLFTQSRGAFVALAAGLVTVALVHNPVKGILTAVGLALAAAIAYPAFAAWRFGEAADNIGTAAGRTDAWADGLVSFAGSPVFGVGLGRFVEESSVGIASHNWYVQVLAELGLVGVILWASFVVAVLLTLRHRSRPARIVGYSALATWSIAAVTMSPPETFQFTGPVLITIASACAALWVDDRDLSASNALPVSMTSTASSRSSPPRTTGG